MASPGNLTIEFLRACGYKDHDIAPLTSESRLLQDMLLCGDDIWDMFQTLHDKFGVDFSSFNFDRYFPNETSGDALTVSRAPWLRKLRLHRMVDRVFQRYPEVTLDMIENMIKKREWIDVEH